jgi:hypothetical protein
MAPSASAWGSLGRTCATAGRTQTPSKTSALQVQAVAPTGLLSSAALCGFLCSVVCLARCAYCRQVLSQGSGAHPRQLAAPLLTLLLLAAPRRHRRAERLGQARGLPQPVHAPRAAAAAQQPTPQTAARRGGRQQRRTAAAGHVAGRRQPAAAGAAGAAAVGGGPAQPARLLPGNAAGSTQPRHCL